MQSLWMQWWLLADVSPLVSVPSPCDYMPLMPPSLQTESRDLTRDDAMSNDSTRNSSQDSELRSEIETCRTNERPGANDVGKSENRNTWMRTDSNGVVAVVF